MTPPSPFISGFDKPYVADPGSTITLEKVAELRGVKVDKRGVLYFEIPHYAGSLGNRVVIYPNAYRDASGRYKGVITCVAVHEDDHDKALKTFYEWENFKNFYECLVEPWRYIIPPKKEDQ